MDTGMRLHGASQRGRVTSPFAGTTAAPQQQGEASLPTVITDAQAPPVVTSSLGRKAFAAIGLASAVLGLAACGNKQAPPPPPAQSHVAQPVAQPAAPAPVQPGFPAERTLLAALGGSDGKLLGEDGKPVSFEDALTLLSQNRGVMLDGSRLGSFDDLRTMDSIKRGYDIPGFSPAQMTAIKDLTADKATGFKASAYDVVVSLRANKPLEFVTPANNKINVQNLGDVEVLEQVYGKTLDAATTQKSQALQFLEGGSFMHAAAGDSTALTAFDAYKLVATGKPVTVSMTGGLLNHTLSRQAASLDDLVSLKGRVEGQQQVDKYRPSADEFRTATATSTQGLRGVVTSLEARSQADEKQATDFNTLAQAELNAKQMEQRKLTLGERQKVLMHSLRTHAAASHLATDIDFLDRILGEVGNGNVSADEARTTIATLEQQHGGDVTTWLGTDASAQGFTDATTSLKTLLGSLDRAERPANWTAPAQTMETP